MSRNCRFRAVSRCLLALALELAAASATPAAQPQELYLHVIVNGSDSPQLARFLQAPSGLLATAATLRKLGLKVTGDDEAEIELSSLADTAVNYDAASQQLRLTVPVRLLDRAPAVLRTGPAGSMAADSGAMVPGLVINYDIYADVGRVGRSLAAWSELRSTGLGTGTASQSWLARSSRPVAPDSPFVRLDSSWRLDDPEKETTLELGDTITSGFSWTRRGRIGGISLRRNFSLRPYAVTAPFPLLAGEAVLPSTVELFIDGIRQSSHQVPAGPFQIDATPRLNGAGTAQIQVRDILGQTRSTTIDFYGTPGLLRAGLSDWSVEAGFPRRAYGIESNRYDASPVLNATGRHGWDDRLTVEGMLQAGRGTAAGGVGAAMLLGRTGGVFTGSLALSRDGGASGHQYGAGYSWYAKDLAISASTVVRSRGYAEAVDRDRWGAFTRQDSLFIGGRILAAQVGLGYARDLGPAYRRSTLSASASLQVPGGGSLNMLVDRNLGGDRGWGLSMQLVFPLGSHRIGGFSARKNRSRIEFAADATQAADLDGWGWRVRAAAADGYGSGEAHLMRSMAAGRWSAGIATGGPGDAVAARASASGSLLVLANGLYPMRSSPDAFALVQTDGVPGVPVRLENRLIGMTDAAGQLLVPDLLSHQRNRISIDAENLALDLRPDLTELEVTPPSRAGTMVPFRLRRIRPFHGLVRDPQGSAPPPGTVGYLRPDRPGFAGDRTPVVVGHGGEIYVEDLLHDSILSFEIAGRRCELPIRVDAASAKAPQPQVVRCVQPLKE